MSSRGLHIDPPRAEWRYAFIWHQFSRHLLMTAGSTSLRLTSKMKSNFMTARRWKMHCPRFQKCTWPTTWALFIVTMLSVHSRLLFYRLFKRGFLFVCFAGSVLAVIVNGDKNDCENDVLFQIIWSLVQSVNFKATSFPYWQKHATDRDENNCKLWTYK